MEKDLKFLRENFVYIFMLGIVLKELRKNKDRLDKNLSKIFISSITRNYLLSIAALLDPIDAGRGNENISIHAIEGIDLKPHEEVVNKIKFFRRKGIAHNDRKVMHIGEDFFNYYDLKPEDVELLFEYMLNYLEDHLKEKLPRGKILKDLESALREFLN